MKNTILIAAALACLASCNKGLSPASAPEIVFRADGAFSAEVGTKAAEVTAGNLNHLYVSASYGTSGSETEYWTNTVFTKESDKYISGKYWPNTNPSMHFYASNLPMTFTAGGAKVSMTDNSTDLVCAYIGNPRFQSENTLSLRHVLARIGNCKIYLPQGYQGSGLSVKLTPKVSGIYDIPNGRWSSETTGAQATIATQFGSGGNSNDIYLIPGNYTLTATYTLTKDAYTETITKTSSVNLAAGMINLISATLPEGNAKEITFTVTVDPWTDFNINASF